MKKLILPALILSLIACSSQGTGQSTDNRTDNLTGEFLPDSDSSYYEDEEYTEPGLFEGGNTCKSDDGCIAIRAGVHPGSGTAPEYWAVWTISDARGHKRELRFADSPYIDHIYTIRKDDGSKYYITTCFGRASSCDGYSWIEAYRIVGDSISEVNPIDGSDNLTKDADFEINYDIPSWYDSAGTTGHNWIHEYDPISRNLYVPVNEERTLTDRYNVWHFNGARFVSVGEQPHRSLHKTLADYTQLLKYITTDDYIIRIDALPDGQLRYASWKKPKTMADAPDMVIVGGTMQHYDVASDQLGRCDDYTFSNNGYQYIVNYCEVTPLGEGYGEHHDYLLVKKGPQTLLKQEIIVD